MRPLLIEIGPVPIRSYGLMIVIGFLFGLWLAIRRGNREGIAREIIVDLSFYLLLSALIGSKLLHVIIFWSSYVADIPHLWSEPIKLLNYLGSGLVFFGGFLAAVPTGIIYVRRHGLSVWQMADIIAPSIPLAHGFGRIGCFLAGCCYGKECDLPWAVVFTNEESLAPLHVHLHPTQLYEALFNFALAASLVVLSPYLRRYGQLFWTYVMAYAIGRSVIEFFRDDERGSILGGVLSTSQVIALVLFAGALLVQIVLIRYGLLRERALPPTNTDIEDPGDVPRPTD